MLPAAAAVGPGAGATDGDDVETSDWDRTELLTAADGATFDGRLALPAGGAGPGLLLLQEIFGVNAYLRDVAERLAGMGYVVLAPDLYWRIQPGISLEHDDAALDKAFEYAGRFDAAAGVRDAVAALAHLRGLPETDGRAGVIGFCLGGTLAYFVAVAAHPDTAICYYGSAIAEALDDADKVTCPAIFHYGGNDDYIPAEHADHVREAFALRDDVEVHVQPGGGHAFDNHRAPRFWQPQPAAAAWRLTADFLARTLPTG